MKTPIKIIVVLSTLVIIAVGILVYIKISHPLIIKSGIISAQTVKSYCLGC